MTKCINNFKIYGKPNKLKSFNKILTNNFSMEEIVPLSEQSMKDDLMDIIVYGSKKEEAFIEPINHMYCNFNPEYIECNCYTKVPILEFWIIACSIYDIDIECYYYNPDEEYAGTFVIKNGDTLVNKYIEDKNDDIYKEISNLDVFKDIINKPKQRIISFKDLKER